MSRRSFSEPPLWGAITVPAAMINLSANHGAVDSMATLEESVRAARTHQGG
ncbi:hypothetical protein [Streptomyces longhuiensis]|uniref:hypothetical protein n=1 Tax=Streptomyces longhuiensis TaxID=2880933 RepID=UPI001D0B49B0|nr:hypothetical protein [Streptomyces longhuiensis]UDM05443.1 hypothetical protein LGI35_45125 [Streptomyces longhuiensis]